MRDAPKSHLVTETAGPGRLQGRTAVHLDSPAAERQRRARELKSSEIRYRRLFETAPYGILVLDAETGVVIDVNPSLGKLIDANPDEILDQPLWSVPAFRNAADAKNHFRELLNHTYVRYEDLPLELKDGRIKRVEFTGTPFRVDDKDFVQCIVHDVTDRVRREERQDARAEQAEAAVWAGSTPADQATHDQVTGLVNRCFLEETLPRELHRAQRAKIPLTITVLELDSFAKLAETHGPEAGEAMLREVGRVIREHLRKSDTACRYAAEEFVLVLPQSSLDATLQRVQQVGTALRALEVTHGDQRMTGLTVSAGVATAGVNGSTAPELLRAAHAALTAARNGGGDRVVVQPTQEKT